MYQAHSNIRVANPWGSGARALPAPVEPASVEQAPQVSALAYRGAGFGEKTLQSWDATPRSADSAILPEAQRLAGRSGDLLRNNGFAAGVRQTQVDNIIGPMGLRLSPKVDYIALGKTEEWARDWNRRAAALFRTWANDPRECDIAGLHDFADQQTIHFYNTFSDGDAFALPMWDDTPGRKWRTRLMGIQPARVRNPQGVADTNELRGGIRFDANGRPLAAHISKRNPTDLLALGAYGAYETTEVPFTTAWGRRRIIHLIERREFGQTRGVGALAQILAQAKQLDQYLDYEMKNQMLNALIALVIETPTEDLLGAFADRGKALEYLDARKPPTFNGGANVMQLKVGEKATAFSPNRPGPQLEQFAMIYLREMCAATNLPYELFTKDFSKSSYVGIRAGLAEAVRFFTGKRYWLATGFCQPAWELVLEEAVNRGDIEAPGFYDNIAAYAKAKWLGARYSFTDRVKEITASVLALENNLTTYEEEHAMLLGEDFEDVIQQRAAETKIIAAAGLSQPGGPVAVAAAGAPQVDPNQPPADEPAPNKQQG